MLGNHAISCGNQGGGLHDSLRDAIYVVTQTACLGASKEERDLLPDTQVRHLVMSSSLTGLGGETLFWT